MPVRRIADVFVDVCTQRDYLSPCGRHRTLNADPVLCGVKHLMAFARWAKVPILSCVDAQRADATCSVRNGFCLLGTLGQQKVSYSVLPDHVLIESDNRLCVPLDVLQQHQQAILVKQHRDPFTNPKLDRLLTEMPAQRYFVFGVALESSVRLLVLGLLLRHRRVSVVHDCCGFWNPGEADMALRQLAAKGCELVSTSDVLRAKLVSLNGNGRHRLNRHLVA